MSRAMSTLPRRDTSPELALRRLVHRAGLRYVVDAPLPGLPRRRADLLFSRRKVVVFVDGCFWHGCPEHCRRPRANGGWWSQKIEGNMARDQDTDLRLAEQGWTVIRVWEHEPVDEAAARVVALVRSRSI
ncbi:very short patch repair endonuclease [Kocuria rosea]|uniref:very short patch repair endonuclease n=1 Tax=Kocuria rosea TaxID=1275 RepID=UPI00215B165D|nr:very short patch repair endonuclease [Kocuria rosea]